MSVSVLSVGTNHQLLGLRNWVISNAGYVVEKESDVTRAEQIIAQRDFDLVVLCHSIPVEERIHIAAHIKNLKPATLILVVRADGEATGLADASVHSMDGAEALLKCMGQLLSSRSMLSMSAGLPYQKPGAPQVTPAEPEDAGSARDPEERPVDPARRNDLREKMLDKTLADSFPTSDPPSTIPDPSADDSMQPASAERPRIKKAG